MTTVLSATRERFLLDIVDQVPMERIEEIHCFPPLVRGGIESGVAVLALSGAPGVPARAAGGDARGDRYQVFTANYRLVRKGVDRGQWESAVVEEGAAPLVTVESVVRGVQRRSGDEEATERLGGEECRSLVRRVRGGG